MFIKHGEWFQVFLEERFSGAEGATGGLTCLLEAHGVAPRVVILDLNCGIGRDAIRLEKLGYHEEWEKPCPAGSSML